MRKLLSVILSLVMVLSVLTPVFAEEAPKAPEAAPTAAPTMAKHIEFLKEQGIIQGDKTGNLMLDQNIDRASFAAILVRAAGKEATAESVKTLAPRFKDLTVAHWANGYATVALESNLMKGNPSGEFMPGKQISYAEIATTLVRFLGKEKAGFVYPTSYIAAATELGLFKDVEIGGAFTANATRDNVFKMLYNAVSKEDFGRYNVYKVIFLENDRVAELGADELNAEVLSVVQIANKVSERGKTAKIGEKFVLNVKDVKVEGGLADTENLIGKVADVTLDENNKLVKVVVDYKNYEYLYGGFKATANGKEFKINNRRFNVRFDERYFNNGYGEFPYARTTERDDRVYRTYVTRTHRAENFNYMRFAERINLPKTDRDYIPANFARITVKDGMVLFVDAYCLTDIAPVKSGGGGVYYWNDSRDGAVERMTPARRVIGFTAKDGFRKIKAEDIKADDTIHWMDGFTLVRQDAKVEAKLVKTFEDEDGEWIIVKGADDKEQTYYLNSYREQIDPYRSVYAYDDQHYRTTKNRGLLNDMIGSDVKVLLDIRNGVQLITSHNKFTDRLGLLNKVSSSNGTEFYASNNSDPAMYRLGDGWDSNYYRKGTWNAVYRGTTTTQEAKWAQFSRLDLAYTTADKDEKAKVVAVIDGFEYNGDYFANPFGERDPQGSTWKRARFVNAKRNFVRVGAKDYRYTDDTEVFVINVDEDRFGNKARVHVISGVTMEDVKKYNKNNNKLEAAVLTEAQYAQFLKSIKVNSFGRYDVTRDNFAKAIIFTNYEGPQTKFGDPEVGRLVKVDNWTETATIEVTEGQYEDIKILAGKDLLQARVEGQFVEFRRAKDSDPVAARFDRVVPQTYVGEIKTFDNYLLVNGKKVNIDKLTKVFGDSRTQYGWVYANEGYADLIVFTDAAKPELRPVDRVNYAKFQAELAKALIKEAAGTLTNADGTALLTAYNAVKNTPAASLVSAKEMDDFNRIMAKAPGAKFQEKYNEVIAKIQKMNTDNTAEANGFKNKADRDMAEALIEEANAYTGLVTAGTTDAADISALKAKITAFDGKVEADKLQAEKDKLGKYQETLASNLEDELMNAEIDVEEAKLNAQAAKRSAIKTAINDLKTDANGNKAKITKVGEYNVGKSLADSEFYTIKSLIAEYKALLK